MKLTVTDETDVAGLGVLGRRREGTGLEAALDAVRLRTKVTLLLVFLVFELLLATVAHLVCICLSHARLSTRKCEDPIVRCKIEEFGRAKHHNDKLVALAFEFFNLPRHRDNIRLVTEGDIDIVEVLVQFLVIDAYLQHLD